MDTVRQMIEEYLNGENWRYDYREDGNYFIMRMNMRTVDYATCVIQLYDNLDFIVYTIFPIKATEEKAASINEFLSRANYGLKIGNFELDFEDGEIRYKNAVAWNGSAPDQESLDRMINIGFSMVDRYAPGILAIQYGSADPKAEITRIEGEE